MPKTEVIVVGTGYGGAASASLLARAGLRVTILERGTWWGAASGHRPLPETLLQILSALEGVNVSFRGRSARIPISRRGLIEAHLHGATVMMNAVGVGGTSLVNGALMQRAASSFFDALPPEVTAEELEPCYREIEDALEVSPGPTDPDRGRLLAGLAEQQGWKLVEAPQAIRWKDAGSRTSGGPSNGCIQCNRCIVGCNVGAKRSTDLTLVRSAIDAGAELRDLCAVESLSRVADGYEVRFRDLRSGESRTCSAPRVVLAAGTLNTLKILFRSRDVGLGAVSERLGEGASLGADTVGFYRTPVDVVPATGNGHSAEWLLEGPTGGPARGFTFGTLSAPVIPRSRLLRRLQGRRTLTIVGFGRDEMNASFRWNGRAIELHHESQAAVGQIHAAMDELAGAYGWDKPAKRHDPDRPERSWMSVHPMGGCTMASDRHRGVVDYKGEVFGCPGLHVADASVFAGAPASGPALSIAALATWISRNLVERAGRPGS